jgi:hypothetical protein
LHGHDQILSHKTSGARYRHETIVYSDSIEILLYMPLTTIQKIIKQYTNVIAPS